MISLRSLHASTLSIIALGLLATACTDASSPINPDGVTSPRLHSMSDGSHGGNKHFYFLEPISAPARFSGTFDSAAEPVVRVCELEGGTCGRTVAEFSMADGARGERVRRAASHYAVQWSTRDTSLLAGARYRVSVLAEGAELGFADLLLLGDARSAAKSRDGGTYPLVLGQTLPIRFRIEEGAVDEAGGILAVDLGAGVVGNLAGGLQRHRRGTLVDYDFTAAPGYQNVLVSLDGRYLPPAGTIRMDSSHVLMASADQRVVLHPGDEALLASARAVLTAADPVAAYQRFFNATVALYRQVGPAEASRRVRVVRYLSYDPIQDSAAVWRVQDALAGVAFEVDPISGTLSRASVARATTLSGEVGAGPKPALKIVYVNGIWTQNDGAAATNDLLTRVVEQSPLAGREVRVEYLYNPTRTEQIPPVKQRLKYCMDEALARAGFWGFLRYAKFIQDCVGQETWITLYNADLVESARQYVDILGVALDPEPFAVVLAQAIQKELDEGTNVIVVPHSQGNLMLQQAMPRLQQSSSYSLGGSAACVGAVSLAAPRWAYPMSPGELTGVAIKRDLVVDFPRAGLPGNPFPRIETDSSRKADREINAAAQVPIIGAWWSRYKAVTWGMKLHAVDTNYLYADESVGLVTRGLDTADGSLTRRGCGTFTGNWSGTTVSPLTGITLQQEFWIETRGDTAYAELKITAPNGAYLFYRRVGSVDGWDFRFEFTYYGSVNGVPVDFLDVFTLRWENGRLVGEWNEYYPDGAILASMPLDLSRVPVRGTSLLTAAARASSPSAGVSPGQRASGGLAELR